MVPGLVPDHPRAVFRPRGGARPAVIFRAALWGALLVPVLMMARYGLGFVDGDVLRAPFFMMRQMAATQPFFSIHTSAAGVMLLIGWAQMLPGLRRRWPGWHRGAGRVYASACLIAAVASVPVALHSVGGRLASAILIGQAALWVGLLWPAMVSARRRRIADHRRWMIRHYGLTCSAIMLRAIMATGLAIPYTVQLLVAIGSSLLLAEWVLRSGGARGSAAAR